VIESMSIDPYSLHYPTAAKIPRDKESGMMKNAPSRKYRREPGR
jgi:hypothetical protein